MPYVNTGWATYQLLEEYYLDNGQATGVTKPNQVGDPDYIPPVYNPALCTLQPPTPTATSNGIVPCGTAVVSQNALEVVTVHAAPDSGNYQIYYDFGTFPVKAEVYYINNSNQEILLYTTNTFVTGNNILFVPVSTAVSGNFFYVRLTATNANAIWNYTIYCPTVATPVPTPTPTPTAAMATLAFFTNNAIENYVINVFSDAGNFLFGANAINGNFPYELSLSAKYIEITGSSVTTNQCFTLKKNSVFVEQTEANFGTFPRNINSSPLNVLSGEAYTITLENCL